jgi:phage terminase Nu1 subunit (DNA packaging protein)
VSEAAVEAKLRGVKIEAVMQLLNLGERRIYDLQREKVVVKYDDGSYNLTASAANYIRQLQQAAAGKALSDEAKSRVTADVELTVAKKTRLQMDIDERAGLLVQTTAVHDSFVKIIRVLAEGANSLSDLLEDKAGLLPEELVVVNKITDQWRVALFERCTEALGGKLDADEIAQHLQDMGVDTLPALSASAIAIDEAVPGLPTEKKTPKRGRPRLKQDAHTASLIDE